MSPMSLAEFDVGGLPVVDRGNLVIGLISQTGAERDADHRPRRPCRAMARQSAHGVGVRGAAGATQGLGLETAHSS
jgi:hypothetical protein